MEKKVCGQRLLALDVLRGITIVGMILVNNPGSYTEVFAPLQHAAWNGLTPTDLVFPFFMFMMGISIYFSLRKFDFQFSFRVMGKILKRTVLLFLIGLGLNWLYTFSWDHLRILGILQRLAICYGVGATIVLLLNHRYLPYFIMLLLVGYGGVLLTGSGFEYNEVNVLAKVDAFLLTPAHMYNDHGLDPEGVLSTCSAIAHVLLGFWVAWLVWGRSIVESQANRLYLQLITLFLCGVILTFSGFLCSYGCPINKKVWSPTFVLTTCGLASSLLACLIWAIDVKCYKRWTIFFKVFGVNPLFMYVFASVLAVLLGSLLLPVGDSCVSLHDYAFRLFQGFLNDKTASLLYALVFVGLNWSVGYLLYRCRIIIKL